MNDYEDMDVDGVCQGAGGEITCDVPGPYEDNTNIQSNELEKMLGDDPILSSFTSIEQTETPIGDPMLLANDLSPVSAAHDPHSNSLGNTFVKAYTQTIY